MGAFIYFCNNSASLYQKVVSLFCRYLQWLHSLSVLPSSIVCPDQFILHDGLCFPMCAKWQQFHNADTLILITPISCGFGLIGGICFFIASFVRCKQMSVDCWHWHQLCSLLHVLLGFLFHPSILCLLLEHTASLVRNFLILWKECIYGTCM